MKAGLALVRFKELAIAGARQAKLRKGLTAVLAIVLFLQLYFVRELIAAELLFGLGFLVLLVLVGIFYAIGFLGERTFNGLEAGYRVTAAMARRAYGKIEELSKKPFRHPRSESAR